MNWPPPSPASEAAPNPPPRGAAKDEPELDPPRSLSSRPVIIDRLERRREPPKSVPSPPAAGPGAGAKFRASLDSPPPPSPSESESSSKVSGRKKSKSSKPSPSIFARWCTTGAPRIAGSGHAQAAGSAPAAAPQLRGCAAAGGRALITADEQHVRALGSKQARAAVRVFVLASMTQFRSWSVEGRGQILQIEYSCTSQRVPNS